MSDHSIALTVNSSQERLTVSSHLTLLQMLRDRLGLTGTKNGCSAGECGACTVLMDGNPVNACLVLAVEADGHEITTIEGLSQEDALTPLQESFADNNAVQCGFCTPGVLMSSHALLQRNPDPSREDIEEALVGNLCRCTGYVRITRAVKAAARERRGE
jgi:carbon-monoxide dehydrogenase small subunit